MGRFIFFQCFLQMFLDDGFLLRLGSWVPFSSPSPWVNEIKVLKWNAAGAWIWPPKWAFSLGSWRGVGGRILGNPSSAPLGCFGLVIQFLLVAATAFLDLGFRTGNVGALWSLSRYALLFPLHDNVFLLMLSPLLMETVHSTWPTFRMEVSCLIYIRRTIKKTKLNLHHEKAIEISGYYNLNNIFIFWKLIGCIFIIGMSYYSPSLSPDPPLPSTLSSYT